MPKFSEFQGIHSEPLRWNTHRSYGIENMWEFFTVGDCHGSPKPWGSPLEWFVFGYPPFQEMETSIQNPPPVNKYVEWVISSFYLSSWSWSWSWSWWWSWRLYVWSNLQVGWKTLKKTVNPNPINRRARWGPYRASWCDKPERLAKGLDNLGINLEMLLEISLKYMAW